MDQRDRNATPSDSPTARRMAAVLPSSRSKGMGLRPSLRSARSTTVRVPEPTSRHSTGVFRSTLWPRNGELAATTGKSVSSSSRSRRTRAARGGPSTSPRGRAPLSTCAMISLVLPTIRRKPVAPSCARKRANSLGTRPAAMVVLAPSTRGASGASRVVTSATSSSSKGTPRGSVRKARSTAAARRSCITMQTRSSLSLA